MARFVDESIDYMNKHRAAIPAAVAVLAFVGLGRLAKMAALGMAAVWVARELREMDRSRSGRESRKVSEKAIDTAVEDSFPASDPASYTSSTVGTPDEEAAKTPDRSAQMH